MSIIRYNPFKDLLDVEKEFNRVFNSLGKRFGENMDGSEYDNAVWSPFTDIYEDNDNYKLKIDLPGIAKEDVKISFEDGTLSVSGERKQEKESDNGKYHRVERTYGKFFRSFTLPQKIKSENIEAEFNNGQLVVNIPKAEEAKPKQLEIKVK